MPAPAMQSVAADLYDRLAPLAALDEDNGYVFSVLAGAVGAMWQQVADLSEDRDGRPGWTTLVDVETTPGYALPWLAAHAGVTLTKGATEDQQRDEVRARSGVARGRPASTIAKVQAVLSGAKSVRLLERSSSAWTYAVVVRTGEVPETDQPRVNLLPNPGPETNTTGWSAAANIFNDAGATLTWVSSPTPQIGPGALRIVTSGVNASEGTAAALPGTFKAGQSYTFAVYLRGNAGGETVQMFIGASGDGTGTGSFALTTGWVRYSLTWTPSADRTGVLLAVQRNATPAATFYLNAGIVAPGSTPADYGKGDSPGWAWDGTPDNSASHRIATTIVYDAALAEKPGGDIMTVVISDNPLWNDATRTWDGVSAGVTWDAVTIANVT